MRWPFSKRSAMAVEPVLPQDAYALWAPSYPPHPHNRLMEVEQAAVTARLPELRGCAALDAGCGTGRYLRLLAEGGATATGVDLSERMLTYAGAARRLIRGSVCALPLASQSMDLVVCGLALGDVEDLVTPIGEMARVLRPGGRLIYSVVHPNGAAERWSRTFEADGRGWAVAGFWHPGHEHRAACALAGLTITGWDEPHLGVPGRPVALVVTAARV